MMPYALGDRFFPHLVNRDSVIRPVLFKLVRVDKCFPNLVVVQEAHVTEDIVVNEAYVLNV